MLNGQLSADSSISNGVTPQANLDALAFAQQVAAASNGSPIYLTGHSLGGEEAEYVEANANFTVSGGTAFAAPGVPNLSSSDSNTNNFTTYVDYGDVIGNFVPTGGSHVGNVQFIGNPLDATNEQILLNDDTGVGTLAADTLGIGDHFLNNYAKDLGVTLAPTTQNETDLGAADVVDMMNAFGVVPYGGVGQSTQVKTFQQFF